MAVDLNIQMKKFNGTDYDILSPKTKAEITSYNNTLGSSLTSTNVQDVISEISSNVIIPATATHTTNITAITTGTVQVPNFTLTFVAPSDFVATDTYKLNNTVITLTDLNGLPVANGWKLGSPVTLNIIGTKAFFKSGSVIAPKIPTYTGQSAVYGDDKKGYMQIFTGGNLTFNSDLLIDIFLVGGGGGGARDGTGFAARGGGGGGYTGTWTAQPFTKNQTVSVTIGSGSTDGYPTSFANKYSVNGGLLAKSQTGHTGGNGGSGGGGAGLGATGGNGGSNGSNGSSGSSTGGIGQGTTTAAFRGDIAPFTNMYFGGGGGGGGDGGKGGIGFNGAGDGGSGIQGESHDGKNGTPNTGGGGGGAGSLGSTGSGGISGSGGSGIAIIRWGY